MDGEVITTIENKSEYDCSSSLEKPLETAKSKSPGEGKDIGILTVVLISVITSVLSIFCYDHFFATKIVIADFEGYMMSMRKAAEAGQIGIEDIKAGLDEVNKKFEDVPKKDVILLGSVVLKPREMKIIEMPSVPTPAGQLVPDQLNLGNASGLNPVGNK